MSARSKIEWTDASWNPIRARDERSPGKIGWHCEKISAACKHCYAEAMNKRLGTGTDYHTIQRTAGEVEIFLDETMLLAPLKWRKPRKIFVCSTTDLFGDWVTDEWLDHIFAVMALAPQHTFQVLTKRPKRMREYFADDDRSIKIGCALGDMLDGDWIWNEGKAHRPTIEGLISLAHGLAPDCQSLARDDFLPLPNVWLGVTAENQHAADERIPELLATPAAVRFCSIEPMLGNLDLCKWLAGEFDDDLTPALDWIITGGESGPNARPSHPDWFRSLRDQCAAAGVPLFFKQWGEYAAGEPVSYILVGDGCVELFHGEWWAGRGADRGAIPLRRLGKSRAGRLLDGVEWSQFPEARGA